MSKRILITGCKGQLGSELERILVSGRSELGEIPAAFVGGQLACVDMDALDITDKKATYAYIAKLWPDVIFNCAAYTDVDGCEAHEEEARRVNGDGAANLVHAAAAVGAKLVHISTDYVFPGDGERPYLECDPVGPVSAYGRTKREGELAVMKEGGKWFIVRTAWLYGYTGKNFVKTILRLGKERGTVTVVNDQRGNPTNAVDLAYNLLRIADTENYGIYHCTGNGACTWYEFASEIIRLSGIPATLIPCTSAQYGGPTKRPAYSCLENAHLLETIGDEMRDWPTALAGYFEHEKEKKP